jgi:hypothetical protein
MTARMPRLIEIQIANAMLAVIVAAALWALDSRAAAIACVVGAAVMMLNLMALAGLVHLMLAAGKGGGGVGAIAAVAAPLKLLFTMALFYLLMARAGLDIIGFATGAATQIGAIMIATGRAMVTGAAGES